MRTYVNNLSIKTWLLVLVPILGIGYPIARVAIAAAIHAVVPDVVRNVLNVI